MKVKEKEDYIFKNVMFFGMFIYLKGYIMFYLGVYNY